MTNKKCKKCKKHKNGKCTCEQKQLDENTGNFRKIPKGQKQLFG